MSANKPQIYQKGILAPPTQTTRHVRLLRKKDAAIKMYSFLEEKLLVYERCFNYQPMILPDLSYLR